MKLYLIKGTVIIKLLGKTCNFTRHKPTHPVLMQLSAWIVKELQSGN